MVLTALVYVWLRFLAKRASIAMAKAMSDQVSTIENINKPVISWYLFFSVYVALLERFSSNATFFIGILVGLALLRQILLRFFGYILAERVYYSFFTIFVNLQAWIKAYWSHIYYFKSSSKFYLDSYNNASVLGSYNLNVINKHDYN